MGGGGGGGSDGACTRQVHTQIHNRISKSNTQITLGSSSVRSGRSDRGGFGGGPWWVVALRRLLRPDCP